MASARWWCGTSHWDWAYRKMGKLQGTVVVFGEGREGHTSSFPWNVFFFFFVIVVNVDLKCEFHQIHPSSLLTSGSQGPNSSENLLSGSYFTSRVPPLDFVIDQLS